MKHATHKQVFTSPEDTLSLDTDAAGVTEAEKISRIAWHFEKIMETLGLDMADDSLKDTPRRVAKMYVTELFSGLDPANFPSISLFENSYRYHGMLLEKDIQVYSVCEHHFIPFVGKAHVAYFPGDKVIGLSKLNRIVNYFSRRPQVQERLTMDIAHALRQVLQTEDVAVVIEAQHHCVSSRGVGDVNSRMVTNYFGGRFQSGEHRMAVTRCVVER